MARTFIKPGKTMEFANDTGGDFASGDVLVIGVYLAVALVDIADGESGTVSISGVHELPKVAGTAWTQGSALAWDASGEGFVPTVTPATGDLEGGAIAHAAAASADTTGEVHLIPNAAATAT